MQRESLWHARELKPLEGGLRAWRRLLARRGTIGLGCGVARLAHVRIVAGERLWSGEGLEARCEEELVWWRCQLRWQLREHVSRRDRRARHRRAHLMPRTETRGVATAGRGRALRRKAARLAWDGQ
jgi:hypothetical protein